MKHEKKTPVNSLFSAACCLLCGVTLFFACSFNYGETEQDNEDQPDIVMKDVEYVRMRDGYPVVRFSAEEARRFEKKQSMKLDHFRFEQFETRAESVNAVGNAGLASIELDSGNIHMQDGVRIEVESEDLAIATASLEWRDKERHLSTGEADQVAITRSDGTSFTGWGFSADTRRRSWEFKNGVEGAYVDKDEDEEAESPAERAEDDNREERSAFDGDPGTSGAAERAGAKANAPPRPPIQAVSDKPAVKTEKIEEKRPEDPPVILEGAK
jgi:LPS export ABC transporter protein LptC